MLIHVSYNTFLSVASPAIFPTLGNLDRLTATLIGGGALASLIVICTRGRLGYQTRPVQRSGHANPSTALDTAYRKRRKPQRRPGKRS
jgi:hypothetical protein